jgi:N-acetylglutamate synthase/N-acetylornithine aminotransferase
MNFFASQDTICLPKGFSFSAAAAGIKASGRLDLALAEACPGTTAAAVFTKNRVVAAPLQVGRASLAGGRGQVRAVQLCYRQVWNPGLQESLQGNRAPLTRECRTGISVVYRDYWSPTPGR